MFDVIHDLSAMRVLLDTSRSAGAMLDTSEPVTSRGFDDALYGAVIHNHVRCAQLILSYEKVDLTNMDMRMIDRAYQEGYMEMLWLLLLNERIDVNRACERLEHNYDHRMEIERMRRLALAQRDKRKAS